MSDVSVEWHMSIVKLTDSKLKYGLVMIVGEVVHSMMFKMGLELSVFSRMEVIATAFL